MGTKTKREISITEARDQLTSMPEMLESNPGAIAVTRRGKPVLAVMPWDLYESILETIEIMGDEDLMADLRRAIGEISAGEAIDWERAKKEL
jgi:PHD/YefM family antitoxin component YafN of YafNO toxin-antitoxin module